MDPDKITTVLSEAIKNYEEGNKKVLGLIEKLPDGHQLIDVLFSLQREIAIAVFYLGTVKNIQEKLGQVNKNATS